MREIRDYRSTAEAGLSKTAEKRSSVRALRARGVTLLELSFALFIFGVTAAISIPIMDGAYINYKLRSAVGSVTWAIQTTRYQSIMNGYPFKVAIISTNNTYQISSDPNTSGTFSNVGGAIPIPTSGVTISAATTIQCKPNGSLSATVGAMNFTMTYQGLTKTITVSNYGNISVTP